MTDPTPTPPVTPDSPAAPVTPAAASPPAPAPAPAPSPRSRPRWGLRLLLLLLLLLLVALFLGWRGCLPGQGGGGKGTGKGKGEGMAAMSAGVDRAPGTSCELRVDPKGISVAGQAVPGPDEAVAACGETRRALLRVTGDATSGTVERLEAALRAKGFTVQREKPPAPAGDPPAR